MPVAPERREAFLMEAFAKGAVGAIVDSGVTEAHGATISLSDFPNGIWKIAKRAFNDPSAKLRCLGVTGTNGKTTIAWMLRHALDRLEGSAAYLGTLGWFHDGSWKEVGNTTPWVVDFYHLLREAVDSGQKSVSLEVSSHALVERRVHGVAFRGAVYTHLTQDHLDFHGSMAAYAEAKKTLFFDRELHAPGFIASFNLKDSYGSRWHDEFGGERCSFIVDGEDSRARVQTRYRSLGAESLELSLLIDGQKSIAKFPVAGAFNAENLTGVIACLVAQGFQSQAIVEALQTLAPVPGRFERVEHGAPISVFIDYAHTPDSLAKVLETARPLTRGSLWVVFGCGGDRDRTKRSLMGQIASQLADEVVITSDNPRSEDPETILAEIALGVGGGSKMRKISDRREAIRFAVENAEPGDTIVVAGKGHEESQIVQGVRLPFSDRAEARAALMERFGE
jgi:UDP-N-acetylmuramoyl-L-alanyl-D-glutamate--2,6-diaminopimelate ligase